MGKENVEQFDYVVVVSGHFSYAIPNVYYMLKE